MAPAKSAWSCAGAGLWENKIGLIPDGLGWAANAALPEDSAAVAIVGSAIGVAGVGAAIADNKGFVDSAVAGTFAYTGKLGATAEGMLRCAGSALGHRIGVRALIASSLSTQQKRLWTTINVSQGTDVGTSRNGAKDRRPDLILGACTAAVFIGVAMVSSLEKALAFSVAFGVFSAVIQAKWKSRHDWRLWAIVGIFGIAHVAILSLIHIAEPRFGLASLPFAIVDGFAMLGLINWIERRFPLGPDADNNSG